MAVARAALPAQGCNFNSSNVCLQAALQLYDDLLPLVRQHLATSPFASIAFTGHSLGGSLASLLMLLFVARGVLPPDCVSPVYTFGVRKTSVLGSYG